MLMGYQWLFTLSEFKIYAEMLLMSNTAKAARSLLNVDRQGMTHVEMLVDILIPGERFSVNASRSCLSKH
eukprot:scaffold9848_cov75-Skeletonema_dohrnii-CCMP3373.AAC.1